MLDRVVIKLMSTRKNFYKLYDVVRASKFDSITLTILEDFKKYYKQYPNNDTIDMETFATLFKMWHPTMKDDNVTAIVHVIYNSINAPDTDIHAVELELNKLKLEHALRYAVNEYSEGSNSDLAGSVNMAYYEYQNNTMHLRDAVPYRTDDVRDLLKKEFDDSGYSFRLESLNRHMRKIRAGDNIILAARPGKGKTTFLTDQISYIASQIKSDDDVILWFNNEGETERILLRLYQSALGLTIDEMLALGDDLITKYEEVVGNKNRVRLYDAHKLTFHQILTEINSQKGNIVAVVWDMIDNVRGVSSAERHSQLEHMYQMARENASSEVRDGVVIPGYINFMTSQISAEGKDIMHPTEDMLKDSKTGKQGAADAIIMIGHDTIPNSIVRGLGVKKSKLGRPGVVTDPHSFMQIDVDRGRFIDTTLT